MSTMPMPGQTWLGAAAPFLAMWVGMMVAMMLPSLVPTLCRYRQAGLGLMAVRLGLGVMDLRPMAIVAAAITGERLVPAPGVERVARGTGAVALGAGLLLIGRAAGLG